MMPTGTIELGGPRPGCSANRVRRMLAGELAPEEREDCARHVAACARCQAVVAEAEREQEQLRREVPFQAFAAGVAEKLAARPARTRLATRWMPLAAAAAIALVAGAVLVRAPATEDSPVRAKGAAGVELFVAGERGPRALALEEKVAEGARLQLVLHPAGHRYAAAVLVEPAERTVLYSGAAVQGPLPQSFEWTGAGAATLVVTFADEPISDPAAAPAGAEVVRVALRR